MAAHVAAEAAAAEMSVAATDHVLRDAATWGGNEKAAKRFRRWANGHCTQTLDIAYCRLTSLPVELGQFRDLTGLDCSHNQLVSLPAELGQLQALGELNCRNNQLVSLPMQLGQLQKLSWFFCDYNRLTSLPAELAQLCALTWFTCTHNQLTSLPVEMGQLTTPFMDCAGNAIPAGEPTTIEDLRVRWESRVRTKAARA